MEDREFFDLLYMHYTKTTGAEDSYWQITEHDHLDTERRFSVDAVDSEQSAVRVAAGLSEADADFVTAVHGCFPDLIRRMHEALDEADRLDEDRDNQEVRIADLVSEIRDLEDQVSQLKWERGE